MRHAATLRLAACAMLAASPSLAQRATEAPSADTGIVSAGPVTPPPPGFPSYQSNLVFGGAIETHLQAEATHSSIATGTKYKAFNDTEFTQFLNYQTWFSLNGVTKLERNRDDNLGDFYPDRNAFFRSEGITQRQLYATVRPYEGVAVYGGKIHPAFGSAYDQAPGIFYNFGTDYEQDERIGFGGQVKLPGFILPNAKLSIETFFLDTSVLSRSLLSSPGLDDPTADRLRRFSRSQFGPSNTGSFDSFTLALRGGTAEQGLTYQVSLTQEATSDPAGRTEYGESVGVSYDPSGDGIPISPTWGVVPFAEYAHFDNFAGIAKLNRHYATAGLNFIHGRWNVAASAGLRKSTGSVSHDFDHIENISFTYEVVQHLQIGAGYNFTNIAAKSSHTLAPSLTYSVAF